MLPSGECPSDCGMRRNRPLMPSRMSTGSSTSHISESVSMCPVPAVPSQTGAIDARSSVASRWDAASVELRSAQMSAPVRPVADLLGLVGFRQSVWIRASEPNMGRSHQLVFRAAQLYLWAEGLFRLGCLSPLNLSRVLQ